jgi:hypothetical protein
MKTRRSILMGFREDWGSKVPFVDGTISLPTGLNRIVVVSVCVVKPGEI